MSLAALAGYASDSDDASDSDKDSGNMSRVASAATPAKQLDEPSTSKKTSGELQNPLKSGVDSIEDDEEFVLTEHAPEFPEVLFAGLPPPKPVETVEEDVSDIVPVAVTKPTKRQIVVPKLSDFKDDDDDLVEKPKPKVLRSAAGSDLIALLPKPAAYKTPVGSKTSLTQLKPHSLGKRPAPQKEVSVPKKVQKILDNQTENDEDDEAGPSTSSFFSFDEPKLSDDQIKDLLKKEDLAPRKKRDTSPDIVGPALPLGHEEEPLSLEPVLPSAVPYAEPESVASSSNDLPAEVLLQLRGRRKEKIEMFTIDAADFTAEARSNLVKNITVEDNQPPPTEAEPTRQHKSKHHITHLAFMAKARENDLKNQWSANRMTKRETQQKYGF